VVLTRQRSPEVPRPLADAVSRVGGHLYILETNFVGPIAAAQSLRKIARVADLIVLHLFPDDVVPLIAFANKNNLCPIVFNNLADHQFWLGVGISDVVAHLRESGSRLSEERRGIEQERGALLPIPIEPKSRSLPRWEAKERLGYSKDTVVILSIASPYKYTAITRPDFVEAIMPVLEKHRNAILVAIGPTHDDQWARGNLQTQGRIVPLGSRSDTTIFYEAADIYIDSFPYASNTSLLEAGSYGVPLVSYCPHAGEAEVLCAGAPGLTGTLIHVKDLEQYKAIVSNLIEDAEFRLRIGENTRKKIFDTHTGRGWNYWLQRLYNKAFSVLPITATLSTVDQMHIGELDVFLNHLYSRNFLDLGVMIEGACRALPYTSRLRLLLKILKLDQSFSFGMFLPGWLEARIEGYMKGWRKLPWIKGWLHDTR
jgi:hypothetical protein